MARPKPPLWRQAFDAVDSRVSPPLERAVQSDVFADALALAVRGRRSLQREVERQTRRVLHFANLPTATDVRRVADQLADLQRQTRRLEHRLEEQAPARPRTSARKTARS